MAGDNDFGWQENCDEQAVAVSHVAGPVVGEVAAGGMLFGAGTTSELPPLSYEMAMNAASAYEIGKEVGGPAVGLLDYGACEGAHYAGEGAHYLNDEAHQAAQAVADYISESSSSNPQSTPTPEEHADSAASGASSFLEAVSSEGQTLNDEAQHAAHTVLEYFEPSTITPEQDLAPPAWSPDLASNSESSMDSHEGTLPPTLTTQMRRL